MNEPAKKPGQLPEGYQPRTPEIVSMVEQAQEAKMKILEETPSFRIAQLPEFEIFGLEGIVTPKGKKGSLRSGYDLWRKLHLSYADGDLNSPYEVLFRDAGAIPAWMPPEMCRIHAAGSYRDTGAGSFPYMLFAFAVPGGKTGGYTTVRFPAGTWAMFSGLDMQGKEPGDVIHALRERFAQWLSGCRYERAQDTEFEMYGWKNDDVFTDLWFPIREKQPESYQPRTPEIVSMVEAARAPAAAMRYVLAAPHTLETERLIVRKFRPKDWRDLQRIALSNEKSPFADCDTAWPTDSKGIKKACKSLSDGEQFWAVEVKASGKVVCFVNFNSMSDDGTLNVGHVMNGDFTGNGYEYEALGALYAYAFEHCGAQRITATWTLADEEKLAPLRQLGMTITETFFAPKFRPDPDGTTSQFEACRLRLTKEDF